MVVVKGEEEQVKVFPRTRVANDARDFSHQQDNKHQKNRTSCQLPGYSIGGRTADEGEDGLLILLRLAARNPGCLHFDRVSRLHVTAFLPLLRGSAAQRG
jgi:hypothetical protein